MRTDVAAVGAGGSRLGGGGVAEGGASSPAKPDHGSGCPPLLPDSRRMASAPGRSYRPTSTEADIERMAKAKKQNKYAPIRLLLWLVYQSANKMNCML